MRNNFILLAFILFLPISGCVTVNIPETGLMTPGYAAMASKVYPEITGANGYTAQHLFFKGTDSPQYGLLLVKPGNRVTVLYFGGGNFQTGLGGLEVAKEFEALGVNIFIVDYPGYGESSGKPSVVSIKEDGLRAYDYLHSLPEISGTAIVVHGFSMGTEVAPYVAANRPISGLVLESPLNTVKQLVSNLLPWYERMFVRVHLAKPLRDINSATYLKQYTGPLLLLVGANDTTAPPNQVRELYRVAATPTNRKILDVVPGRGHDGNLPSLPAVKLVYSDFLFKEVLNKTSHDSVQKKP
ncbi:MAG: alpha/beta hydrolase [Gammaproteobacteria bacterium]